jgi:hypothetical protein
LDPLETKSYIHESSYAPVIEVLDSIMNRRIRTPSSQIKK